ncbi:MAG: DNA-binding protein [Acidimicrobiales bacterium]
MSTVAEVLESYSLDEDVFARELAQALAELHRLHGGHRGGSLTDSEVRMLEEGGLDLSPPSSPASTAVMANAARMSAMATEALSVAAASSRLGIDPTRVRHRLAARRLYGIRRPGGWRLPSWQFLPGDGLVPGIDEVLAALPSDLHPLAVWGFLAARVPELAVGGEAMSPLKWLVSGGGPGRVVALGASLGIAL